MPVERSVGAVLLRKTKNGYKYLLLHYPGGHWGFPKGHIEKGEKSEDTARREIKEETGINSFKFIPGFKKTIRYFVDVGGRRCLKFVAYFLALTRQKKVTISWEHQGFAWLSYEEAYKKITYQNARQVLKEAHNFISKKGI